MNRRQETGIEDCINHQTVFPFARRGRKVCRQPCSCSHPARGRRSSVRTPIRHGDVSSSERPAIGSFSSRADDAKTIVDEDPLFRPSRAGSGQRTRFRPRLQFDALLSPRSLPHERWDIPVLADGALSINAQPVLSFSHTPRSSCEPVSGEKDFRPE